MTTSGRGQNRGPLVVTVALMCLAGPACLCAAEGVYEIHAVPRVITDEGVYVVTRPLVMSGAGTGIMVTTNDVVIDLNGFMLDGGGTESRAIVQVPGADRLTVRNGFVNDWMQSALDMGGRGNRLEDVTVTACRQGAGLGEGAVVEGCMFVYNEIGSGKRRLLEVGKGGIVRRCIIARNETANTMTCVKAGVGTEVTECVIYRNACTSGWDMILVDGADLVSRVSAFGNRADEHQLSGFVTSRVLRACAFTGNSSDRDMVGYEGFGLAEYCVAHSNAVAATLDDSVGFRDGQRADDSAATWLESLSGSDPIGFVDIHSGSGCVSAHNPGTGFGMDIGAWQYCVAYASSSDGFLVGRDALLQDCLASRNGSEGAEVFSDPSYSESDILDLHAPTNRYGAIYLYHGEDTVLLRSSSDSIDTVPPGSNNDYGQILDLTAGDEVDTPNPWANFEL